MHTRRAFIINFYYASEELGLASFFHTQFWNSNDVIHMQPVLTDHAFVSCGFKHKYKVHEINGRFSCFWIGC